MPDQTALVSVVEACAHLFALEQGKWIHAYRRKNMGLAWNGDAFEKFSEMEGCGVVPSEITFVALLDACRHVGLLDEGRRYFKSMTRDYRIKPNVKHHGCMSLNMMGSMFCCQISLLQLESGNMS